MSVCHDVHTVDASRFKALVHPARLALLTLIIEYCGTLNVNDLCDRLCERLPYEVKQPVVSHHLAILTHAGFIESTRDGFERYYRLRAEGLVCYMDVLAMLARMGRQEITI